MDYNPKKILVINEGSSDNFGDQAINESIKYLIEKNKNFKYYFQDLSRNKVFDSTVYLNEKKELKNYKRSILKNWGFRIKWFISNFSRINKSCKNKDYVIIGGGQLLLANNIFPFELFIWTIFFKIYKLKFSFFSVGTQDNFSFFDKFFLKYSINNSDKIYVRDQLSKSIIKKYFKVKPKLTYDTAFIFNKIDSTPILNSKNILLGPVNKNVYDSYNLNKINKNNYHEMWYELIKDYDIKLIKLFYSTNDDRFECIEFKKFIYNRFNEKIEILNSYSLKDFIKNIKSSKLIISGRMHSLILAKTFGINYKTFLISDKLIEFESIYKRVNLLKIQKDLQLKFKSTINFEPS